MCVCVWLYCVSVCSMYACVDALINGALLRLTPRLVASRPIPWSSSQSSPQSCQTNRSRCDLPTLRQWWCQRKPTQQFNTYKHVVIYLFIFMCILKWRRYTIMDAWLCVCECVGMMLLTLSVTLGPLLSSATTMPAAMATRHKASWNFIL